MHQRLLLMSVSVLISLPAAASAQGATEDEAPIEEETYAVDGAARWRLQFEPIAWAPALNGNLDLTGGVMFDIDRISLSEISWAPAWQVSLRDEKWTLTFDGFDFESSNDAKASGAIDGGGVSVVAGDTVDYDVNYAAYTLVLGYRVWSVPITNRIAGVDIGMAGTPQETPADGAGVFFDVLGGARLYDLDLRLSSEGSVLAEEDHLWVDAIVGARVTVDFPHGIGLDLAGDIGTLGSDFAWNVEVGLQYAINDNVAAEIGFRHLDTFYTADSGADPFEWDIVLAGLYGSIVIRF